MNILIVDDNSDISQALAEILFINDICNVKTVSSAMDALDYINKYDTHLVISDLLMPKVSGLELYDEVRKLTNPPKFILITGCDPSDVDYDGYDSKLTILQKPFNSHLLVGLINSLEHKLARTPAEIIEPKIFSNIS